MKMFPAALSVVALGLRGVGALSAARADIISQSSAWKAAQAEAAEDTQFWEGEWQDMETELLQLQAFALGTPPAPAAKPAAKTDAKSHHHFNPLAGLKLNLEPKSPADLVPALAMLKGLYEDGKQRVGQLNAREKKSKDHYEAKKAEHDARIAAINAKVKDRKISKEFAANETHDENRLWTYWQHVRERQHRQFHTSLKISHATLNKEKQMIDVYEKTIAGKAPKKELQKEFNKVAGHQVAPEVVFLQGSRNELAKFCDEQLKELHVEHTALLQTDVAPTKVGTF